MESIISEFRALHDRGCFVIPNPWDPGSARFLEQSGFRALATTSAGFAFSRGLPDEVFAVPRDMMLAHLREMVAATRLPLNADFQSGYAHEPEDVAANTALCIATGVAGLSIEDATGDASAPLYERHVAIERIRAARGAIDRTGTGAMLTARCEAWLTTEPKPFATALDRLAAYADAGADCLFAPGVRDPKEIAAIVREVAPKPVNVIVTGPGFTVKQLEDLGVRRISVGSALARSAWSGLMRAARAIASEGRFDELATATSFAEMNQLFSR